jgi:hypothetical protein
MFNNHGRVGTAWKGPRLNESRKRLVVARFDGQEIGVLDIAKATLAAIGVYVTLVLILSIPMS